MFVVDLMHEFELGVWKSVFTHLIRMLVSLPGNVVNEFNLRCVSDFFTIDGVFNSAFLDTARFLALVALPFVASQRILPLSRSSQQGTMRIYFL